MLVRTTAALVLLATVASDLQAQVRLKVVRKEKQQPVVGARIRVVTHPGRNLIEEGKTDKDGLFIAKRLPGAFAHVYIIVRPREADLESRVEDHRPMQGVVITIQLFRKIE